KLDWAAFERKYLAQADGGRVLTLVVARGAQPASPRDGGKSPTGAADDPLLVLPEFRLELRSRGAVGQLSYRGPGGTARVEVRGRLPLPFLAVAAERPALVVEARWAAGLLAGLPAGEDDRRRVAAEWLLAGGDATARLALERRAAPPRLAPLATAVDADAAP